MLTTLKRLALFAAVGALVADGITLAFAPALLRWFQTPAVGGALCNCAQLAEETARALVNAQAVAAGAGAVVFVVAGEALWRVVRARRSAAAIALVSPTSPSSPSSPS